MSATQFSPLCVTPSLRWSPPLPLLGPSHVRHQSRLVLLHRLRPTHRSSRAVIRCIHLRLPQLRLCPCRPKLLLHTPSYLNEFPSIFPTSYHVLLPNLSFPSFDSKFRSSSPEISFSLVSARHPSSSVCVATGEPPPSSTPPSSSPRCVLPRAHPPVAGVSSHESLSSKLLPLLFSLTPTIAADPRYRIA